MTACPVPLLQMSHGQYSLTQQWKSRYREHRRSMDVVLGINCCETDSSHKFIDSIGTHRQLT